MNRRKFIQHVATAVAAAATFTVLPKASSRPIGFDTESNKPSPWNHLGCSVDQKGQATYYLNGKVTSERTFRRELHGFSFPYVKLTEGRTLQVWTNVSHA